MYESDSSDEERVLAERLRREAEACRPEFSETLHRRLCGAIRRGEAAKPVVATAPVSGWLLRHGLATALAAAGVLIATTIVWQSMRDDGLPPGGVDPSRAGSDDTVLPPATEMPNELAMVTDLASLATEEVGNLVESTVTRPRWASLDRNTKLALEAINNRVPLDAVASLVFADESVDSWWESPDN